MAINPCSVSSPAARDDLQCPDCRSVASHPRHADTPKHLQRFSVRDEVFGPPRRITAYECPECSAIWRWSASQLWVCVAMPASGITAPPPGPTFIERIPLQATGRGGIAAHR